MNGLFSSVQSRLTVLVGGGIGLLLLVASIAVFQLKSHLNDYHYLISHNVEFERDISELNLSYKTQVQEWKNVLLRGKDPEKLQKYWDQFSVLQKEIQAKGDSLVGKLPNDDSKKLLQDFLRAHAAAYPKYEAGLNAFKAADFDASAGDKAVTGIDREPSKMLSDCANFIHTKGTETNAAIESSSGTVVFWSQLLVAVFGIAIIALVLFTLKNSFVAPLLAVINHMELLAHGNFKTRLRLNQQGELGELNRNIDRMQDSLISVINAVRESSNTLNNSSKKITDVAHAISVDTDNSHRSTDQVAAAINEMTSTVQEVANNASGAANAGHEADEHARKGVEIMDSTIASIQQLSEEVDNVSTAMTQLETETARAGEQGRGFAVVADEVRALAKRTQESTAEIQHIILAVQQGASKAMTAMKVSQTKTQSTSEMAGQAGQAISSITEAVARIHMMNTQIATAAEEQSYAAEEINKNVVRVVTLVESAAGNAQKSTHVATELNSVARELERQITHFNH